MNNYRDFSRELDYSEYMVKNGDSLFKIAKLFNTTVEEIMILNRLATTTIYPNQILLVPNQSSTNNETITKTGDTIKDILDKYDLDLCDLMENDSFLGLELVGNQVISSLSPKYYVVSNNDSAYDILSRTKLSSDKLIRLNEDSWFKPGNKIIVG